MDLIRDYIDQWSEVAIQSSDLRLVCGCALLVVVPFLLMTISAWIGWWFGLREGRIARD